MKILVQKENLERALGFVEKVASKNAALPILSNILIRTNEGRLQISATNLEIGVVSAIGAKITEEGQIAVPGRIFSDFVRGVKNETLTLSTKQNTLFVDGGSMKTSILGFDATEYPIIPKINQANPYTLPAQTLQSMLGNITDSIALSESRPELAGAFVSFLNDSTVVAATDSFRLAEQRRTNNNPTVATVIIPRGTVMELLHILGSVTGDIAIRVADNQIEFSHSDCQIISRLIDGRYPEYHKVIPERYIAKVLVHKKELENAIKTTALFSSSISDVKVDCENGALTISAKNSSKGEAQATMKANLKGDPFNITVNHHYFLDGLKIIPTETVVIEFTGNGSPFVLRPSDDKKEGVYLIMPLRN